MSDNFRDFITCHSTGNQLYFISDSGSIQDGHQDEFVCSFLRKESSLPQTSEARRITKVVFDQLGRSNIYSYKNSSEVVVGGRDGLELAI